MVIRVHLSRWTAHLSGKPKERTGKVEVVREPRTREAYEASNDDILLVMSLVTRKSQLFVAGAVGTAKRT